MRTLECGGGQDKFQAAAKAVSEMKNLSTEELKRGLRARAIRSLGRGAGGERFVPRLGLGRE